MPMAAHQRHQATVPGTDAVDLAPASQEVPVDQTNHMEAAGDDQGVGKLQISAFQVRNQASRAASERPNARSRMR